MPYDPDSNEPFELPKWIGDFFAFRTMLTPILVRVLFAIGLPAIVWYCYDGFNYNGWNGPGFIAALLLSAVLLPIWRVACETAIVLFSIHEEIRKK